MKTDLTKGNISRGLFIFAGPMIAGNILQQVYSFADTLIVGRFISDKALASVGSTYTLTTFLYSIIIGFCMGCGSLVSFCNGKGLKRLLHSYKDISFMITGTLTIGMEVLLLLIERPVLLLLQTPEDILEMTSGYLSIILAGMVFVFLYNYYAYVLRGLGNSVMPLIFLGAASILNIGLDLLFVLWLGLGVQGAACATLISQACSGCGLMLYCMIRLSETRPMFRRKEWKREDLAAVLRQSGASSVQQSVMNFGILMIQGLVNSFGTVVMAAFTVAVKIDTIAYMPAQEYGNAYSLFVAANFGAGQRQRIKKGTGQSFLLSGGFCILISCIVFIFAESMMSLFVEEGASEVVSIGVGYLRLEGVFYVGIGLLFLLYGYFRGIQRAEMSLLLTVISLGTRVVLAYLLSSISCVGVWGIWVSIPIGWFLADTVGIIALQPFKKIKNK